MASIHPLVYLYRDLDEPTDNMWAEVYPNEDARYGAITVLRGEHYQQDDSTMYTILKEFMEDCPAWTFIKRFDRSKDGRGAFMALKTQCEGTSSILTRKNPSIRYVLPALSIDEKHLEEIQTRSLEALFIGKGLNRHFPRRITHGPQAWGGLGILDIETEGGLSHIKEFRHALYGDSEPGKLMMYSLK